MSLRSMVWLAVASVLISMAFTQCATADEPVTKSAAVIILKHMSPSRAMLAFGLVSREDYMARKATTWYRSSAGADEAATSHGLPAGIDIMVPCDADRSLIVYGTEDGIEQLRVIMKMLDVEPKHVQIKGEFYHLTPEQAKQVGLCNYAGVTPDGLATFTDSNGVFRPALEKYGISPVAAPIISTVNNEPASVSISNQVPYEVKVATVNGDGKVIQEKKTQFINVDTSLYVTPRVNSDGTITLMVEAKAPADSQVTKPTGSESLKAQTRVADGESLIISKQLADRDVLVVIVTPTVVKSDKSMVIPIN